MSFDKITIKKGSLKASFAEREGFEPPEVLPSTVFKTAAIDHSAISPVVIYLISECKGNTLF